MSVLRLCGCSLPAGDRIQDIPVLSGDFLCVVINHKDAEVFEVRRAADQIGSIIEIFRSRGGFPKAAAGVTFEAVAIAEEREAASDGGGFGGAGGEEKGGEGDEGNCEAHGWGS